MGEISEALERARNDRATDRESGPRSPRIRPELLPLADEIRDDDSRSDDASGAAARQPLGGLEAGRHRAGPISEPDTPRDRPLAPHHSLPCERIGDWPARIVLVDPTSAHAARFRHLAVRIRRELDRRLARSLLVTSSVQGEGKTTVSVNLALAMASFAPEYRIALVDLDLHRANLARALCLEPTVGIESVIRGENSLDDARVTTDLSALDLYPVARCVTEVYKLLGGAGVARALNDLTERYDYVILDGPPVLPVPDVPIYAAHVGGFLGVVRCGVTRRRNFREMLEILPPNAMIGAFLNESVAQNNSGAYAYRYEADPSEEEGEASS